jgi:SAM-dependent methyltransferase
MTTSSSYQEILKSLDCALEHVKWKGPPSDLSHLNSPEHLACFSKLGNQEQVTSQRIIAQAKQRAAECGGVLRICSIGCEDGKLDRLILEGLKNMKIEYVGLDTDEQVVEGALEKLQGVSPSIDTNAVAVDYEEVNALSELALEPFDLVWMVNCTYYATSLKHLIQSVLKLLTSSGVVLIISSSRQSIEELVTRFWSHQRKHPLQTTESVLNVLTQSGVPYEVYKEPVSFDLTTHFRSEFQSAESQLVLDQLVFCRLSDYPSEVKKLVIEFLQTIAKNTTETAITVTSLSDLIYISP